MTKTAQHIVTIERMAYGPEGIAHLNNGKTVFVSGAVTGDRAAIAITEDGKTFARAHCVEIEERSPLRVCVSCGNGSGGLDKLPCTSRCGGCPWSALQYGAQLDEKRSIVVEALVRNGHIERERAEKLCAACAPSKHQTGYRNKLEMGASFSDGRFELGLFEQGSHDLYPADTCPLAAARIGKAPKALRGSLRFAQGSQDLGIFRVGVRHSARTGDTEIALWTTPGAFPRKEIAKTLRDAQPCSSIVRVIAEPGKSRKVKQVEVLSGKGYWEENLGEAVFFTSAPSFFQVNTAQAEKLVEFAISGIERVLGEDLEDMRIADLYAGGGTFAISCALRDADVVAVESAGSSVRDLRRNAEINGVWVDVIGGDTARELPHLGELDALIVDPPRAGLMKGVVESIVATRARAVAYVSCDPQTLGRDIAIFETLGYRLESVQPVDMFPQTYHVETVCILSRVKSNKSK